MIAKQIRFQQIKVGGRRYAAALRLREAILRHPLGLALTAEELAGDEGCLHLVGLLAEDVVATLLLQPLDAATAQMRQVAVRSDLQGRGIGSRLLGAAEATARQHGFRRLIAHARATALTFYERHGYLAEGEIFTEVSIPHRTVARDL